MPLLRGCGKVPSRDREDGTMKVRERRVGRAWRNAGLAIAAVGVLVLGTQTVLSATDEGGDASSVEVPSGR